MQRHHTRSFFELWISTACAKLTYYCISSVFFLKKNITECSFRWIKSQSSNYKNNYVLLYSRYYFTTGTIAIDVIIQTVSAVTFKKFSTVLTAYRELLKEVVKMLSHMNALDHIIAVAAEQGIKDIKQLLEAKP